MIVKKNKYKNKYMALRQNKRPQGQIRKTCQRRTNPYKDPQGIWKDVTKTKNSPKA